MAILVLPLESPSTLFGGDLYQTPESGEDRVGSYVEVIDAGETAIEAVCENASTTLTPGQVASSRGFLPRYGFAGTEDSAVRQRLAEHCPIFRHLFGVTGSHAEWMADWLSVSLEDATVPDPDPGYDLGGTPHTLYDVATSMRDAEALGKAQRSIEAVGGDTSVGWVIQTVHPDVEAPISLWSRYIHEDDAYALYRPGAIFQTTLPALVSHRGEVFDRGTHFAAAGIS